tara:strand:+ start:1628 stop:2251 length:624 start_codon:yes stop_codon:yes gene_type:complete
MEDENKIVEYNDFIAVYKGWFNDEHIQQFLDFWDFAERVTPEAIKDRQATEDITRLAKSDNAIGFNNVAQHPKLKHLNADFDDFQKYINGDILELYNIEYPGFGRPTSIQGKIQKTKPGEGYHSWHCEVDEHEPHRVLAWALFLNDVEEGGELEFLYQNKRVKPKKGDFVVWPAYFTHMHRGNPPISDEKYIVTGWYQYVNIEPRDK